MKVAILGAGRLGHGLAEAFCVRKLDVTVWNRTREKALDLAERGAKVASTAAEAIRDADTILCVLVSEEAIMEVLASLSAPRSLEGKAWLNLTSTTSAGAQRLQAAIRKIGGKTFVDLATSTIPQDLIDGKALIMMGCGDDEVATWKPFLEQFGTVIHSGGLGSASAFEMAYALPLLMAHHTYLEGRALLERRGVDPNNFSRLFGPAALVSSPLFTKFEEFMVERTFMPAFMTVGHYVHALRMVLEELEGAGAETISWKAALRCAERAAARGPDRDWSCVYEIMVE